ncbi:MAG: hypothetical protein K6T74_13010 [Geminicoccaceae bacterium]|nr:hypothetical protein [Geminicoccaceae bacterium]
MSRSSIRLARWLVALLLLGGSLLAAAQPAPAQERSGAERISDRDRERARLACRDEARRQDFSIRGSSPARELDGRRLQLRMDLARGDRRWIGTCTYDLRARRAELDARRVESGRADRSDRPGGSASREQVRDACIREVTKDARTQLVAVGRVERRSGGASVVPMTINV